MSAHVRRIIGTALVVMLIGISTVIPSSTTHAAGANKQPVEWVSNPGNQRWSLTSIGQAWLVSGDTCGEWDDYVMRINKPAGGDPDRFRIYSFNGTVQNGFNGKSPIGDNLSYSSSYAHLCLGFRDTWNGGGPLHVGANMFVWVQ